MRTNGKYLGHRRQELKEITGSKSPITLRRTPLQENMLKQSITGHKNTALSQILIHRLGRRVQRPCFSKEASLAQNWGPSQSYKKARDERSKRFPRNYPDPRTKLKKFCRNTKLCSLQ
jgi:hypothetical protein